MCYVVQPCMDTFAFDFASLMPDARVKNYHEIHCTCRLYLQLRRLA